MANVMLFYGFWKTLFHKCVSKEMCTSPSESTAGVGGTPTGCKGWVIALPQAEAWGYRYCSPSGAHTHADPAATGEGRARRRCAVLLTPGFSPGKGDTEDCAPSGRRPHRLRTRWGGNEAGDGVMPSPAGCVVWVVEVT